MDDDSTQDLQRQIDQLVAAVRANTLDIEGLSARAETFQKWADLAENRADATRDRVTELEARAGVDREMIAELQADGSVGREHAAHLEVALVTSRVIGAAIGILMATRGVDQEAAFTILRAASMRSNVKLRDVAQKIVDDATVTARD